MTRYHTRLAGLMACGALLGLPGHAFSAEASGTLQAPEIIQIMTIDGEEPPGSFLGSRNLSRPLAAGEHVLSVRYNQLFNLGADDHDILKSPPVAFRFVVEPGKTYQIQVNPPKHYEDAKNFARNPQIRLVTVETGKSQDGVIIKSLGQASLVDTIGKAFQSATSGGDDAQTPTTTTNLLQLQQLWLSASPAERQAFAAWLAAQAAAKP